MGAGLQQIEQRQLQWAIGRHLREVDAQAHARFTQLGRMGVEPL
jgi:hypothetical protein